MNAHLAEISAAVEPGAHAVLLLDQAGWHTTAKLNLPDNITILPLPAKSPELNPVENIWQFMRDNWLSNRIFESYDQIVTLCSEVWNRPVHAREVQLEWQAINRPGVSTVDWDAQDFARRTFGHAPITHPRGL